MELGKEIKNKTEEKSIFNFIKNFMIKSKGINIEDILYDLEGDYKKEEISKDILLTKKEISIYKSEAGTTKKEKYICKINLNSENQLKVKVNTKKIELNEKGDIPTVYKDVKYYLNNEEIFLQELFDDNVDFDYKLLYKEKLQELKEILDRKETTFIKEKGNKRKQDVRSMKK